MKIKFCSRFLLVGLLVRMVVGASLFAATNTWNNGQDNFTWDTTSTNWTGATLWNNSAPDSAVFGPTGAGTISLGAAITAGSVTFNSPGYILNVGADSLTAATLAGSSPFTKIGANTLSLSGASSYSGVLTVGSGILQLNSGATLLNNAGLTLRGGAGTVGGGSYPFMGVTRGATLYLQDITGHAIGSQTVGLSNGTVLWFPGTSGTAYSETISNVSLTGGFSTLAVAPNSANATLQIGNLSVSNAAAVEFRTAWDVLGTGQSRIQITDLNGSPIANTNGILGGWAFVAQSAGANDNIPAGNFASWNGSSIVAQTPDLANGGSGGVVNNTNLAGGVSTQNWLANSTSGNRTVTNLTINTLIEQQDVFLDGTLTLASGGYILRSNSFWLQPVSGGTGCFLTSGTTNLYVQNDGGGGDQEIKAVIEDGQAGPLTVYKSGAGLLKLNSATNTYTGGTIINQGTLDLQSGGSNGCIRGTVTVNPGGVLQFDAGDAIGALGGGTALTNITLNGGSLNVNTTANQTLTSGTINLTGGAITGNSGGNIDFKGGASAVNSFASSVTSTISGVPISPMRQGSTVFNMAAGSAPGGVDLSISSVLQTTPSFGGDAPGASLIKAGAGVMSLTTAATYSDGTMVSNGVLQLSGGGGTSGTLANSAITVLSGAELDCNTTDALGYGNANPLTNSGTIKKISEQSETLYRPILLKNGMMTSTGSNNFNESYNFFGGYIDTAAGTTNLITGVGNFGLRTSSCYFTNEPNSVLTIAAVVQDYEGLYPALLVKTGPGVMILSGANTYSSATTIKGGTLALASNGSVSDTASVSIAAGATFDVSAIQSYLFGTNTSLIASGRGTGLGTNAAAINGGTTVNLGSQPIMLAYDGSDPALYVSAGTLSLSNNAFAINAGSVLADGNYTIVQQASGSINGTVAGSTVGGTALTGKFGTVSLSGGTVVLTVCTPLGPTGNVAGPTLVGPGQSDVIYSVNPVSGASTYNWTVPTGAAISGPASGNSITVNFGYSAVSGSVSVTPANTNGCVGTASSTNITVAAPSPAIIKQPRSQTAFVGGTVTFTVGASGSYPLFYQWQKNGAAFSDQGNIVGSTNASLIVSDVSATDAAGYSVMVSNSFGSVTSSVVTLNVVTNNGQVVYLSGTDKDHTVPWQFIVSGGANAGILTNIAVPSCWETMGFGNYQYGNLPGNTNAEYGQYTYTFAVPPGWAGQRVFIVFEGVFTDTAVTINGVSIGTPHQGGFYEFKYEVTTNVVCGVSTNVLQVTVNKWSADASINNAERSGDFWTFGGIFRPVYLEAKPFAYIDRIAANPQANGQISVNVLLGGITNDCTVNAFVTDSNNIALGGNFSSPVSPGETNVTLAASLPTPNPWSAESPTLYALTVQLLDTNDLVMQTMTNLIGFRTITFSNNTGFLVNGKKVVMRGICHHEEWPTTGRTTSLPEADLDLGMIKDMNFNAVRMSHYPPNKVFLQECDRLGLYVLDELTGWQQAYDNATATRLVKEMVVRDVNHPCVIAWDNGNEGGWNTTVDNDSAGDTNVYAIWDPQNRKVLRPESSFENVLDNHYPTYSTFTGNLGAGLTAYQCTEILHALYDGGAGASLQEYWDAMRTAPNGMGMFIWSWDDEGIVRTDEGGILDVAGQNAPDGIVGPYREKEASYYACKSIFNPVQTGAPNPANFTGALVVSNRFDFTDLADCSFRWQLGWLPNAADPADVLDTNALTGGFLVSLDSGNFTVPSIPPQTIGSLPLPSLPAGWTNYDAMRLIATDPLGNNLYTWTWPLQSPAHIRDRILGGVSAATPAISAGTNAADIVVTNGPRTFYFNRATGVIDGLTVSNLPVSFNNGPDPVTGSWTVTSITNYSDGTNYYVAVNSLTGNNNAFLWTLRPDGWLKLTYQYFLTGSQNYLGITFDYPSNNVTAMNWLGQGPYRVYKNRLAGQEVFGHTKQFNFGWTGQSTNYAASHGTPNAVNQWAYPEFAGYHGELYWATLQTTEQPITVVTPVSNLFFRVLTPPAQDLSNVNPAYPPGTISFLNGISPMGEKFNAPGNQGPAAQPNTATGLYGGEVDFFFGPLPPIPAVPSGLAAIAGNAQVALGWNAVAGATGYNLRSSTVSGGPYTLVASNLAVTTFTNTGLLNGSTCYYVVSALDANGESETSPQVGATPVAAQSYPQFSNIALIGTNLIFSGTNGTADTAYFILTSSNLALPLTNWTVTGTNAFGPDGYFSFTNPVAPSIPQQFYRLKVP